MNLIGLTGGIGSGKSTVAGIFKTLGVPVYESDLKAKEIMNSNDAVRSKIIALFGKDAYDRQDQLNTSYLAGEVFTDHDKLEQLNTIVHPAVYQDLLAWAAKESQRTAQYILQESAIFFEESLTGRLNAIILVVANEEERIRRVMQRDNISREDVLKRIQHQWPDEKKIPFADYVIYNDHEGSLISQVMDIDQTIRHRFTGD